MGAFTWHTDTVSHGTPACLPRPKLGHVSTPRISAVSPVPLLPFLFFPCKCKHTKCIHDVLPNICIMLALKRCLHITPLVYIHSVCVCVCVCMCECVYGEWHILDALESDTSWTPLFQARNKRRTFYAFNHRATTVDLVHATCQGRKFSAYMYACTHVDSCMHPIPHAPTCKLQKQEYTRTPVLHGKRGWLKQAQARHVQWRAYLSVLSITITTACACA